MLSWVLMTFSWDFHNIALHSDENLFQILGQTGSYLEGPKLANFSPTGSKNQGSQSWGFTDFTVLPKFFFFMNSFRGFVESEGYCFNEVGGTLTLF